MLKFVCMSSRNQMETKCKAVQVARVWHCTGIHFVSQDGGRGCTALWSTVFSWKSITELICCIKIESHLSLCEGVCQTALKTMYSKLEFTKLTKCLQGSHDGLLKERALSDNLSSFEQKMLQMCFFFCVSLRVRQGWHLLCVPEHFPAAGVCWGSAVLWRCIPCLNVRLSTILSSYTFPVWIWGYLLFYPCTNTRLSTLLPLYEYGVIYYFMVALWRGLPWSCSSLCGGFGSLRPCCSAQSCDI